MMRRLKEEYMRLHGDVNKIVEKYDNTRKKMYGFFFNGDELKKVRATCKKELNKLEKDYLALREEIYNIEDQIALLSEIELDHMVIPVPEDITELMNQLTQDEQKTHLMVL